MGTSMKDDSWVEVTFVPFGNKSFISALVKLSDAVLGLMKVLVSFSKVIGELFLGQDNF